MSSEQQANSGCMTPGMMPLNETLWQAWRAKGRARDERRLARFSNGVRYASVAVLLVAAGVWSNLAGYDVAVRFAVAAGALYTMSQAFRSADYAVAAIFAAVALLYNPIAPTFTFAGEWQRIFVLVSAFVFMTSAYWPTRRLHHA